VAVFLQTRVALLHLSTLRIFELIEETVIFLSDDMVQIFTLLLPYYVHIFKKLNNLHKSLQGCHNYTPTQNHKCERN
jgi:hypothetical protein